ncbi:MAG: rhomboid family intramembrane serine protease [Ferruginibacter sp.]|nr:rhomboid family intramembrane serine protease [Ferruginibacter sp.]
MNITFSLIAANVILFFISTANKEVMDKSIMWPYVVKRKNEYHRFITSGFLHADFIHLFFNMFTLYFFGRNIELIFNGLELGGNTAYLLLYFSAIIISDIPSYIKNQNNYGYRSLGASGAVSAIVFANIVFSPWSSIYIYGALKISSFLYAILFVIYCMYMGKKGNDNINHDAHLWGALYGLLFTIILIALFNSNLFVNIIEELKNPSLFGRG